MSAHPRARARDRTRGDRRGPSTVATFGALLRSRVVRTVLAMSVGIFFFNHALNNWLPEILRAGGMDARAAGYWASVPTAVGVVGAVLIPRLATPERRVTILMTLFACAGAATALLAIGSGLGLALALVLQGVARSSMMPIAMLLLMESPEVGAERMGAAGGLFFSTAEIGGVLGPVTLGVISGATGGFDAALGGLTAVCAGLALLLLRLRALDVASGARRRPSA